MGIAFLSVRSNFFKGICWNDLKRKKQITRDVFTAVEILIKMAFNPNQPGFFGIK